MTWPKYWTPEEFGDFCAWLAFNPEAGDVIPRSGCRKVRWVVEGRGKRGGVRIVYFNRLADGTVWLTIAKRRPEVLRELLAE